MIKEKRGSYLSERSLEKAWKRKEAEWWTSRELGGNRIALCSEVMAPIRLEHDSISCSWLLLLLLFCDSGWGWVTGVTVEEEEEEEEEELLLLLVSWGKAAETRAASCCCWCWRLCIIYHLLLHCICICMYVLLLLFLFFFFFLLYSIGFIMPPHLFSSSPNFIFCFTKFRSAHFTHFSFLLIINFKTIKT